MTPEEIEKHNKMVAFDQRASENMRRWAEDAEREKAEQAEEPRRYPRFILSWPQVSGEEG